MVVQSDCLASKTVQDGLSIKPKTVDDLLKTGTHGPGLPQDSSQQVYVYANPRQPDTNPRQDHDPPKTTTETVCEHHPDFLVSKTVQENLKTVQDSRRTTQGRPSIALNNPEMPPNTHALTQDRQKKTK